MNVSRIIHGAARQLGIVASGEELKPSELQDAIEALQGLLAQWATMRLMVHRATDIELPIVAGKTTYLIGSNAGDCCEYAVDCCGSILPVPDVTTEISHIEDIAWIDHCPITMLRDINITGHCADVIYSVNAPNWSFKVNSALSGKTLKIKAYSLPYKLCAHDELHLPGVYERALKLTLAKEIASEYGLSISPELVANQAEALRILKDSNSTPFYDDSCLPIGVGYRRGGFGFYG